MEPDERMDTMFDQVDDWLLEGAFEIVDRHFSMLIEEKMETAIDDLSITLGLLTVTNGARDKLEHRQPFYNALMEALYESMGEDEVRAHLHGLG
jgi:hypothetical protein